MRQYPSWSSSSYRSSQFPDLEKWNTQEVGSDFLKHSRNLYLYIYIYEGIRLNVWKKLELENEIKGHETSHVMLPHHEAKERASALGFTSDNFLLLWEKETYSYTYTYTYTYTYKWCSCIEPNGWSPHNTLSLSVSGTMTLMAIGKELGGVCHCMNGLKVVVVIVVVVRVKKKWVHYEMRRCRYGKK